MNSLLVLLRRLCWVAVLAAPSVWGIDIALRIEEPVQVPRQPGIVRSGVPFAKGTLKDAADLALSRDGEPVPAQFAPTVFWEDGSVRWALLDAQVDIGAEGKAALTVSTDGRNPAPPMAASAEQEGNAVRLSSGPLVLTLGGDDSGLIQSLVVDGEERLTGDSKGLMVVTVDGREVVAAAPEAVEIEQAGPLRAEVRVRGVFPGLHDGLLRYTALFSVHAGQRLVHAHVWLENHGAIGHGQDESRKPEWFAFQGMAVDLRLNLGGEITARCEEVEARNRMKVLQVCNQGDSRPYFTYEDFEYTIASGDEELGKGARTDGVVELEGANGALTVAIRDFWQNYEKAIELDGHGLRLWLWPPEGQWPRTVNRRGLMRGFRDIAQEDQYLLQGSVHKGHELVLDFGGRPAAETAAELSAPLFALAEPEHYAATEALPALFGPPGVQTGDRETDFKLGSWDRMARSVSDPESPYSIFAGRRISERFRVGYFDTQSFWYGWMDFGDLSVPGQGQVSLHYDWPLIVLLDYLRHGNPDSLRLATQMVRHRVDVDQYWSDRDPGIAGTLQRSSGMWPYFHYTSQKRTVQTRQNWVTGLALWHMLTGDVKAREAVLRNVEGLVPAWEDRGWRHTGDDDYGWAFEAFCAAYDLTADSRWLAEAMKVFEGTFSTARENRGPHLRGGSGYCYSIAPLINLHKRTGSEDVFGLLEEGADAEFGEGFFRAPLFLAGLYAYVGVVAERPELLERAADAFGRGFPESRQPPVFQPSNTRWSSESAVMLRSGHAVKYGFWKRSQKQSEAAGR